MAKLNLTLRPGSLLSNKEELFIAAYLSNGGNAKAAAVTAGFVEAHAKQSGYKLMKKPSVRSVIDAKLKERLDRYEVTSDKIIRELAKLGFSNMEDYIEKLPDGGAIVNLQKVDRDQSAAIQEITVDSYTDPSIVVPDGEGGFNKAVVKKVRLKLGDKRGALELLARHKKLLTDSIELTGKDGKPLVPHKIRVEFVEPKQEEGEKENAS